MTASSKFQTYNVRIYHGICHIRRLKSIETESLYINRNRIHKSRVLCTKKKKKCQKWNNPRNRTFNIRIHENRGQSKSTFSVFVFLKVLPPSVLDSIIPPNPLSHSHSQLRTARDPWSIHSHSDAVSPQAGTSLSLSLSLHFKQRS